MVVTEEPIEPSLVYIKPDPGGTAVPQFQHAVDEALPEVPEDPLDPEEPDEPLDPEEPLAP